MRTTYLKTAAFTLLVCLLPLNFGLAKEVPAVQSQVFLDSAIVNLSYELCGSCDESFDKSFCDFSGDICTELLAPLELNYSFLGCLKDRSGSQLAAASIEDVAKLADYLFRGGKELTCDDIAFLSASQILDGVNVVTLTEIISELFERAATTVAEK